MAATDARLHFHLLFLHQKDNDAFDEAVKRLGWPETVTYTAHRASLADLPATVKFDTIVSPANSYGRLDGAFDDAISKALSPPNEYLALTHVVQAKLYDLYRGFAPPGTCTIVRIPDKFAAAQSRNVWGTKHLALCPTMRIPQEVAWDREVIYECIWTLMCAIDRHNRGLGEASSGEAIKTILMTPLATGIGGVSEKRWAAQVVTAVKQFERALVQPERFGALQVKDIFDLDSEILDTWRLPNGEMV